MDLKEQIKTVISETCTHWLISDDADLKKVSKKLTKEFETIINAEIERRKPVSDTEANDSKHAVIKSVCEKCKQYEQYADTPLCKECLLELYDKQTVL